MAEPETTASIPDDAPALDAVPAETDTPPAEEPAPRAETLLEATYHVALWTDPTPTYLCLLCPAVGMEHAGVVAHLTTAHSAEAVPSPIAADYLARNPVLMMMLPEEESADAGDPDTESGGEPEREPGAVPD